MVLKRKATAQHGVSSSYSGFINIAVGRGADADGGGAVQGRNPACGEEEFSNGCARAAGAARAGWGKISALNYCFTRARISASG